MSSEGLLVTAEGETFAGVSVGADGVAVGEVVFNTTMTGYQEVITDPSYAGQLVVMTMPHIGNYGVAESDMQSARPAAAGLVVRSLTTSPTGWRSEGAYGEFLAEHGLVTLADIDTRRLTRYIRSKGAMPAAMGSGVSEAELRDAAASAPSMTGLDLASQVGTKEPYRVPATAERRGLVAAVDLGIKRDILAHLTRLGLDVVVLPAASSAEQILSLEPDGLFLSNGPGDPEPLHEATDALSGVLGKVPVFGICLGHQVLGLALGARTFKLPFGHHGGNHPVRRLDDGRVEITSQNHGFAVDLWSLTDQPPPPASGGLASAAMLPARCDTAFGVVEPSHQNLNDGSLEGMRCLDVPAYSVQYHPEAAPGPREASALFDQFLELMEL
jgi:carbamoyl-phosphate synthase small subunit